jgi:16S rRNA (cytosine1402-N4)-methyltransferase
MTERIFHHRPVMATEIVNVFAAVPGGWIIDATLGGGGHAELLLDSLPGCQLLGLDRDPAALVAAGERLLRFGDRFRGHHTRFDRLAAVMHELDLGPVSGVLLDLGVSSPQLDWADRGFSYRNDGPLDMRMDTTEPWSATDIVNGYEHRQLIRILREYGDERFADRIARAIISARPIETTVELAEIVRNAIPAAARRTGGHPAKRTFQAIRIEVNHELEILKDTLEQAVDVLQPGGRIAVLTYHSGEDRITKAALRSAATGDCTCPDTLPCVCGAIATVRLLKRGGQTPTKAEMADNRRAQSARLRSAEKLPPNTPARQGVRW